MKHVLIFLGVAAGFIVPSSLRAGLVPSENGSQSRRWLVKAELIGTGKNRVIYYYTNIFLTGSHVPVVLRSYRGVVEIVNGGPYTGRAFGVSDLDSTGSIDVAGELALRESSASIR